MTSYVLGFGLLRFAFVGLLIKDNSSDKLQTRVLPNNVY